MARHRAAGARVSTGTELHLLDSETGQLVLLLNLRGRVPQVVEAESVEGVRIGVVFRIEVDGVGGGDGRIALGVFGAVGGFLKSPDFSRTARPDKMGAMMSRARLLQSQTLFSSVTICLSHEASKAL